jgi:DNA-binding beta-propeller fold protein YncE
MRVERLYPMVKPATFVRLRLFGVIGGVLFAVLAWSQLSAPQSVVFDVLGDRYFVACPGNDQIMQRAQDGAISTFVYVHDTPLGLDMKGDTLFACVGSFVEAYSASNATTLFAYDVKGGFLKGVSSDGTFLYVSDMLGKRIVRIDPIS